MARRPLALNAILTDAFLAHAHYKTVVNTVPAEFSICRGLPHAFVVSRIEAQRFLGLFVAAATVPFLVQIFGGERLGSLFDDDRADARREAEAKQGAAVLFGLLALAWAACYGVARWRLRQLGGVLVWRDRCGKQAPALSEEDLSLFDAVFDAVSGRSFQSPYGGTYGDDAEDSSNFSDSDSY